MEPQSPRHFSTLDGTAGRGEGCGEGRGEGRGKGRGYVQSIGLRKRVPSCAPRAGLCAELRAEACGMYRAVRDAWGC